MDKSTISMAIFKSYFDITRGKKNKKHVNFPVHRGKKTPSAIFYRYLHGPWRSSPYESLASSSASNSSPCQIIAAARNLSTPMRVCLKMLCTPKPNGFADHYPVFKWLFHWGYTLFSGPNPWITNQCFLSSWQRSWNPQTYMVSRSPTRQKSGRHMPLLWDFFAPAKRFHNGKLCGKNRGKARSVALTKLRPLTNSTGRPR